MKFKFWILYILLITLSSLYGVTNENNNILNGDNENNVINYEIFFKYRNNFNSSNSILVSSSISITSYYRVEIDQIAINWIKDHRNNNKTTFSVFTLLDFTLQYTLSKFIKSKYSNFFPLAITNTNHSFRLFGNSDYLSSFNFDSIILSLFLKNNTNLYIFRKNNWFEVSPGIGFELLYKPLKFEFGYQNQYQFELGQKNIEINSLFFSIGFEPRHLDGW